VVMKTPYLIKNIGTKILVLITKYLFDKRMFSFLDTVQRENDIDYNESI
ncbi:41056_t:CDS:1, partial [Gigaspora margarita]